MAKNGLRVRRKAICNVVKVPRAKLFFWLVIAVSGQSIDTMLVR
jgi:hypothetical protein